MRERAGVALIAFLFTARPPDVAQPGLELGRIAADVDCQGAEGAELGGLVQAAIAILLRVATTSEAADEDRNRRNSRLLQVGFKVRNWDIGKPAVSVFIGVASLLQKPPRRGRKSHSKLSLGRTTEENKQASSQPATFLPQHRRSGWTRPSSCGFFPQHRTTFRTTWPDFSKIRGQSGVPGLLGGGRDSGRGGQRRREPRV